MGSRCNNICERHKQGKGYYCSVCEIRLGESGIFYNPVSNRKHCVCCKVLVRTKSRLYGKSRRMEVKYVA